MQPSTARSLSASYGTCPGDDEDELLLSARETGTVAPAEAVVAKTTTTKPVVARWHSLLGVIALAMSGMCVVFLFVSAGPAGEGAVSTRHASFSKRGGGKKSSSASSAKRTSSLPSPFKSKKSSSSSYSSSSTGVDVNTSPVVVDSALNGEEDGFEEDELGSFTFTFKRVGYDPLDYFTESNTTLTYAIFANYSSVVEPYADMDIHIMNDPDSETTHNFRYTACPMDGDTSLCQHGAKSSYEPELSATVHFDCAPFDVWQVTVSQFDSDWAKISDQTGYVLCMYVRREIRALNSEDLDKTMTAMHTLWTTSTEDGQELYGESYYSSSYFSSAHDFNAAWQDADHIHEGLGFIPQHIKITNIFETSMQSVDPSISLPYWDFTIDNAENITIFESYMFTNNTFGTLEPPKDHYWGWTYKNDFIEDAVVKDGRWANIAADLNVDYPALQNGFGYIRGPWNMNPSPYVTRFASYTLELPSCLDYFAWASDTDFVDFLEIAPYGPHASTHGVIGAVFGCDLMDPLLEVGIIRDSDSQLAICKKWGFYLKELYRANYISPKTDCTATSLTYEDISCGFTCNEETYDDMTAELETVISEQYLPPNMQTEDWETWRDFICTGDGYKIFVGDHLESASPSDPSFWPIHPTQERLLQAKFISGAFGDYKWPDDPRAQYVCDKAECYESDFDAKDYFDECCYGHYESDQLLDFVNGNRDNGIGPTNKETFDDTNPTSTSYAMHYVYADFKWDHCEEDFVGMLSGSGGDMPDEPSLDEPTGYSVPVQQDSSSPDTVTTIRASGKKSLSSSRKDKKSGGKRTR